MTKKEKLLAAAQKCLQRGQVSKAIKDYKKLVELDPSDVRNRQKLAELYSRDNRPSDALEEYQHVGTYYSENGFYLKAIAVFKQMQKLDPEQVSLYLRLAELNEKQGLVGNALAEYRSLVKFYEKERLLPEAINILEKMKALETSNLNIRVKLAEMYGQGGLKDNARDEICEILEVLKEKGDLNKALKLYEMFLPLFPGDVEFEVGWAATLIAKGEGARGADVLKKILAQTPGNSEILKLLAAGYRQQGNFDGERLIFQDLLKREPADLDLRNGLIRACLDGAEYQKALSELEEWKEAFFEASRLSLLKEYYERLHEQLPEDRQVSVTLNAIYEQTGESDKIIQDVVVTSEEGVEELSVPGETLGELPLEESFEDLDEIVAPDAELEKIDDAAEGSIEEDAAAGEVPLEFLESAEELAPLSEEGGAEGAVSEEGIELEVEPEAEAEVELELDLEFDLDLEEPPQDEDLAVEDRDTDEEAPQSAAPSEGEECETGLQSAGLPVSELPVEGTQEQPFDFNLGAAIEEAGFENAAPDVGAELEEAQFYLQQGLFDEAERVCTDLLKVDASCRAAEDKLAEIKTRRRASTGGETEPEPLFDLAADLSEEFELEVPEASAGEALEDRFGLEGVFSEFKKEVETQIGRADTESHYNLGIAYKEMGLLDDAIGEFDKAMTDPERYISSLTLKAMCLVENGSSQDAEGLFRTGLAHNGISDAEKTSLYYELGMLYDKWERPAEALECFQAAADIDLFFRDVGEKLRDIKEKHGSGDDGEGEPGDSGGKGNADRVSYL